jgi:hypothetical protein
MVEYIPVGIFRSFFKFRTGDKLREKMEGGQGMKHFSVHFNLHKPIQIVFFKNFVVVGAHMKEYKNKWQTTA